MNLVSVRAPVFDSMRAVLTRSVLSAAMILAAVSSSLPAQALAPIGVHFVDTSSGRSLVTPDKHFYLRTVPAVTVGVGTAMMVSLAGLLMSGDCYDCGLTSQALMALSIGAGTVGAATGAAFFPGRGLCTRGERFRKSFVGATLGLATGLALINAHPLQHSIFATVPLGSAISLRRC